MADSRIVKVFVDESTQDSVANDFRVIERYESFVVLEIPTDQVSAISQRFLVEDITSDYTIAINGTLLKDADATTPQMAAAGSKKSRLSHEKVDAPSEGPHHFLVQFIGPIKPEWLSEVTRKGGKVREPLNGFVVIVRATLAAIEKIRKLSFIRWVGHYRHSDRVASSVIQSLSSGASDELKKLPRRSGIANVLSVAFFGPPEARAAAKALSDLGVELLGKDLKAALLTVRTKGTPKQQAKQVAALSAIHGVRRIREAVVNRTCNNVAIGIMNSNASVGNPGAGLSGEGEIIGICDTGLDTGDGATVHEDFAGRVIAIRSYPLPARLNSFVFNPRADDGASDLDSGHGTHVAGSALGSGAVAAQLAGSPLIRGLAYKSQLVFQAVEQQTQWRSPEDLRKYGRYGLWGIPDNLQSLFQFAYDNGARIHTNSWGGGDAGVYGNTSRQVDQFVWNNKDFCVLFAAGNDGSDLDGNGAINPGSVTAPGTAKNCITVGASENQRPGFTSTYGDWWPRDYPSLPISKDQMANNPDQVAAFSSRGPTLDNRTKPDVVAPGTFILSTRSTLLAPNNFAWAAYPPSKKYFHMGGTSMATPLVAGAVGLIREFIRKKVRIAKPSAALLKATLIAGATRLRGTGPAGAVMDNSQGFGRVNLDAVLSPNAPGKAVFHDVSTGLTTGRSWEKVFQVATGGGTLRIVLVYSDYPGSNLVNNLNLLVTSPSGKMYLGNQPAGGTPVFDSKNNVEVVHEPSASPGNWKVRVIASSVPMGPQDFAIVVLGNVA